MRPGMAVGATIVTVLVAACSGGDAPDPTVTPPPSSPTPTQQPAATATPSPRPTQRPAATAAPSPTPTQQPDGAVIGVSEWPMFRLNLQHTGAHGERGLLDSPTLRWRFFTGGTVESSPTVVDGVVYEGTFDLNLFALDAATGEVRWRFPVGGLLRASPSVVGGVVYFGADDNKFYALDAATGEERWSFPLGEAESSRLRRWWTAGCTSAPSTGTSTPWTRTRAKRCGAS